MRYLELRVLLCDEVQCNKEALRAGLNTSNKNMRDKYKNILIPTDEINKCYKRKNDLERMKLKQKMQYFDPVKKKCNVDKTLIEQNQIFIFFNYKLRLATTFIFNCTTISQIFLSGSFLLIIFQCKCMKRFISKRQYEWN